MTELPSDRILEAPGTAQEDKKQQANEPLNHPTDDTDTHRAQRALIIEGLSYCNNHGDEHPN